METDLAWIQMEQDFSELLLRTHKHSKKRFVSRLRAILFSTCLFFSAGISSHVSVFVGFVEGLNVFCYSAVSSVQPARSGPFSFNNIQLHFYQFKGKIHLSTVLSPDMVCYPTMHLDDTFNGTPLHSVLKWTWNDKISFLFSSYRNGGVKNSIVFIFNNLINKVRQGHKHLTRVVTFRKIREFSLSHFNTNFTNTHNLIFDTNRHKSNWRYLLIIELIENSFDIWLSKDKKILLSFFWTFARLLTSSWSTCFAVFWTFETKRLFY